MSTQQEEFEEESPNELSLNERMFLSLRHITKSFKMSIVITIVSVVLTICILCEINDYYTHGDTIEETLESITWLGVGAVIIGTGMGIWFVVKMMPLQKKLDRLRAEYTEQAYYLTLGMSTHKEDVVMDFLEVLFEVFPELKETQIKNLKETGYDVDLHEIVLEDDEGSYTFDACEDTKFGKLLVKNFSKPSTSFDEIKECVEIAKDNFKKRGKTNVFRLICLAKKFDKDVIQEYDKLKDESPPLDLILVTESGFLSVKISRKVDDIYIEKNN